MSGFFSRCFHLHPRLFLLLLTGILVLIPVTVFANVTLVSFEIYQENNWFRLDWETATELNNAGFFVLRNTTGGSLPANYSQTMVKDVMTGNEYTFIPARGDTLLGAVYNFYDQNVSPNSTYYYLLQAVDFDNTSQFYGPITRTLTAPNVTPTTVTPTPTRTSTPTPSPTISSNTTGTPTSTATPTLTPSITPTRTPTLPPTSPPFNTVTPTRTETPTPGPSPTPTFTPSITPSATVTLHPLDLTLTAILAQVTPLPTYTSLPPTRTPFPTWTPEMLPTAIPPTPGFFEGVSVTAIWGLIFSGILLLGGGGTFTYLFVRTRKQDQSRS